MGTSIVGRTARASTARAASHTPRTIPGLAAARSNSAQALRSTGLPARLGAKMSIIVPSPQASSISSNLFLRSSSASWASGT